MKTNEKGEHDQLKVHVSKTAGGGSGLFKQAMKDMNLMKKVTKNLGINKATKQASLSAEASKKILNKNK